MKRFPDDLVPMDILEEDDIVFDFRPDMRDDETITNKEIVVEVHRGQADPDANNMAVGPSMVGNINVDETFTPDPDGRYVIQRFSAADRLVSNCYALRCNATLSSGRKLTATGIMAVIRL